MDAVGIYVAIPFCRGKCTFCNFASDAFAPRLMPEYLGVLGREIAGARGRARGMGAELPGVADTVYLGGGTPSLLGSAEVRELFRVLRGEFELAGGAEMTAECAPGQLSEETLEALLAEGVNRISFGVQSFADGEAAAVGRRHTGAMCREEIRRVRAAGVEDVGVDLIAGLPGQTMRSWEVSVGELVESGATHASVYLLEVDEGSRLGREALGGGARYGAGELPDDEAVAAMYERACAVLGQAGLEQYEISNFARAGRRSRHNVKYWERAPYVGFGLDAHSMLRAGDGRGAWRFANTGEMEGYLAAGRGGLRVLAEDAEELGPRRVGEREALEEAMFLGLRRNDGVSLTEVGGAAEDVAAVRAVLEEARGEGLVEWVGERVRLTTRGRLLSNEVFARLLLVEEA